MFVQKLAIGGKRWQKVANKTIFLLGGNNIQEVRKHTTNVQSHHLPKLIK